MDTNRNALWTSILWIRYIREALASVQCLYQKWPWSRKSQSWWRLCPTITFQLPAYRWDIRLLPEENIDLPVGDMLNGVFYALKLLFFLVDIDNQHINFYPIIFTIFKYVPRAHLQLECHQIRLADKQTESITGSSTSQATIGGSVEEAYFYYLMTGLLRFIRAY